jgi:c-di-GMP-related signal transduction protein
VDTSSTVQTQCTPRRVGESFESRVEGRRISSNSRNLRFIALQPIFDRQGRIFGYEALCRTARSNRFAGDSRDATHNVVRHWLLHRLYRFTGAKTIFLNCTREDLVEGFLRLLPVPVVVEVLETVQVDEWVMEACKKIKEFGHSIALDDFHPHGHNESLVEFADFVKVDFRVCDKEERKAVLGSLKRKPIRFVAEKIETREEFETAFDEGFDLFQGYYLAHPFLFSEKRIYISRLNFMWLRCRSRWKFGSRKDS